MTAAKSSANGDAKQPPDRPRVITPEMRRQMQERYARAQSLLARETPQAADFRRVHELLAANLAIDPGNLRYIDLLLTNLRRRAAAGRSVGLVRRLIRSTPLGARAALVRALDAGEWNSAAELVPEAIWEEGLAAATLGLAADVCCGLSLGPAELRYRLAAVEADEGGAASLRAMARALTRLGQFEDASDWWRKVLAVSPDDEEAARAVAGVATAEVDAEEAALEEQVSANPADVAALLALAERRIGAADFDAAEALLTQASAVGGGDLRIRGAWETLSLARSEHRLKLAQQAAERDDAASAGELVERLRDEHERLAVGIAHARAERSPADGRLQLELAQRLKRSGNYSGAVQRLEELRRMEGFELAALVELGECWQHLRQFEKSLGFYREAIAARQSAGGDSESVEEWQRRALYRGAVLAEALGHEADACRWYEELVARGGYKDARERLDKLR